MQKVIDFFRKGYVSPPMLTAAALVAVLAIFGITVFPDVVGPQANMHVEPEQKVVAVGEEFNIQIIVESSIPVNVFGGQLHFNPDVLTVKAIDYNTSIADLWAERPWFSNGDGTLNFGGGTTQSGGFEGEGSLITVTFATKQEGEGTISLRDQRILLHDGLGTDARLAEPIDAIFTVETERNLIPTPNEDTTKYIVAKKAPSTDLNSDGKQSIADVSIFMLNIAGNDARFDFNLDGEVNLKDLNILLDA